ncbi:MAG: KEOPS complex subunit Cgi121 [Nitrososphaerales archaeon]
MEPRVVSVVVEAGADPDLVKRLVAAKVPGSLVQAVSAAAASNGSYVEMIAAQTLRADGTPSLLARKPEVDLLLRLAGTTQISRAIERIGAKKGKPFLLVVAGSARRLSRMSWAELGGKELAKRDLSLDELDMIEMAALLNVVKG